MSKIFTLTLMMLLLESWGSQKLLSNKLISPISCLQRVPLRGIYNSKEIFSNGRVNTLHLKSQKDDNMQVFSRPTYDRIAKHILSQDETVRLDILKAFTGIKDLIRASQLDEHYNPFDPLSHLRKIVNAQKTEDFFKKIRSSSNLELLVDQKKEECDVLKNLSDVYGDLVYAFPNQRYRSTVDFLCETTLGYVTIEFQVAKQDYWDKRALAYAASIYGNQLRPKQDYREIQDVVAINLLGDGSTPYWKDGNFIRNYTFRDQVNPKNSISSLRLIQYSLGDVDMNHPLLQQDKKLKLWIEFFKSAHEKKVVPESADESLQKAYNMIRVDVLKKEHPELLKASEDFFANLTEHDQAVEQKTREQGKIEFAKRMLDAKKFKEEDIAQMSGLSLEELKKIKKED